MQKKEAQGSVPSPQDQEEEEDYMSAAFVTDLPNITPSESTSCCSNSRFNRKRKRSGNYATQK